MIWKIWKKRGKIYEKSDEKSEKIGNIQKKL
jgi:hypothetical protein